MPMDLAQDQMTDPTGRAIVQAATTRAHTHSPTPLLKAQLRVQRTPTTTLTNESVLAALLVRAVALWKPPLIPSLNLMLVLVAGD